MARDDLEVARIAAAHRGRYELWGEQGVRMGRRTGRLRYSASEIIYDPDAKEAPDPIAEPGRAVGVSSLSPFCTPRSKGAWKMATGSERRSAANLAA